MEELNPAGMLHHMEQITMCTAMTLDKCGKGMIMSKKTLVQVRHKAGPYINGSHGCYARWNNKGMCPGVEIAKWLNALGPDDAPFRKLSYITNGMVRKNWLRGYDHIERAEGGVS
jgi:hypothetical protein